MFQHGFKKGMLCLTCPTAFSNEMTGLVEEGREVDVVYLDFTIDFSYGTVSHKFLTDKLIKYGLDKWEVRWNENWENCQA